MSEIIKGYICLNVSEKTIKIFKNFFKRRRLVCQDNLHVTLIHDTELTSNPLKEEKVIALASEGELYGYVAGSTILGDKDKGYRSPAIIVDSYAVDGIHNYLIDHGYHHSYDKFIAHISINYDVPEEEMDKYISAIDELVGSTIIFDGISVDEIKPREE